MFPSPLNPNYTLNPKFTSCDWVLGFTVSSKGLKPPCCASGLRWDLATGTKHTSSYFGNWGDQGLVHDRQCGESGITYCI